MASKATQTVHKIIKFIKQNTNLMHLDLSSTGLDTSMMREFGTALRRAKSLISLHMSGNPGDDEEVRIAICERAHAADYEERFTPDFSQQFNFEYKEMYRKNNQFKLEDSIQLGNNQKETVKTINDQLALK